MKANELMIGDWVYMEAHRGYEAQYIQVETIPDASSKDHYGHIGAFPVGGDNDFRDIEDRHLFPIPLTPEILEKNGFKFISPCINDNKDAWVYEWPHEKPNYAPHAFLLMSHHNKAEFPNFWICAPNNPDIVYVHQLQHALRLCQIEKEIEL